MLNSRFSFIFGPFPGSGTRRLFVLLAQGGYVFTVCLFACLQDYAKSTRPISTNFGGMVAHVQRKKQFWW